MTGRAYPPPLDDAHAIAAVRDALHAAENASDADAACALLTNDAVLMVPDFPVQTGRDACLGFLREVLSWLSTHFVRRVAYASEEVVIDGEWAFDRGTFSFTATPVSGGAGSETTGKYLWILCRSAPDSWKVARAIMARDGERLESETDTQSC